MEYQDLVARVEELGLSNKEARVYLASLALGPASVQSIADHASIKRVTTYVILESLIGLGLVVQSVKGKKTLFVAEDPALLERLIERRAQELADQKQNLHLIMPKLSSLRAVPRTRPEVRFFDGGEAVRVMFTDFFKTYRGEDREMLAFYNADDVGEFYEDLGKDQVNPERIKHSIASRLLYTSANGPTLVDRPQLLRASRFVPEDHFPVDAAVVILGEHVMFCSLDDSRPHAIAVRNDRIAQSMRALFNLTWRETAGRPR